MLFRCRRSGLLGSILAGIVAALCPWGAGAWAQAGGGAVRLELGARLPFGEAELRRMVDVRLTMPPAPACGVVRVDAGDAGVVVVTCPDRRGEVWIGERTAEDAARTVAIVLADLVTTSPAVPPRAPAPAAPTAGVVQAQSAAPAAPSRLSLWLAPGISSGGAGDDATFEPRAGVGWALGARTRALLELGFAHAAATDVKTQVTVAADTIPLRLGVGVAASVFELQGGVVGRGFRARAGSSELGARAGGWVAGLWMPRGFSTARSLSPFVGVGLDAYLQGMELRVYDRPVLTAGALAPWATVGLIWRSVRG